MLFADLTRHLATSADSAEVCAVVGDLVLFSEIIGTAKAFDESAGEYIAGAAKRYAAWADQDEWQALVQMLQRESTASAVALQRILKWSLARDAAEIGGRSVP